MKLSVEYRVNIMVPRRLKGCYYAYYYYIPLTSRMRKEKCFIGTDKVSSLTPTTLTTFP